MLFDTIDKLYDHLRQFRIPKNVRASGKANGFWEVTENELSAAEKNMGVSIPSQLRRFYHEVGNGHIVVDEKGICNIDYFNIIIDLDRLVEFWKHIEVSFQYDNELIDKDEMAFFDIGSYSYFVLRPFSDNPDAVYYPFDDSPVADSFEEFILKLHENTIFYLDDDEAALT